MAYNKNFAKCCLQCGCMTQASQSQTRQISFRARRLAVPLNGGSTQQAMNSVNNQWKLLSQLKEYLSKTSSTPNSSLTKASSEKHAIFELSKEWINFLQKYSPAALLGYHFQNLTLDTQDTNKKAIQRPRPVRPTHSHIKRVPKSLPVPSASETDKVLPWKSSNMGPSKTGILSYTCHVLSSIATAETLPSKLKNTEELLELISRFPAARVYAVKEGAVKILLRTRERHSDNALQQVIREVLAVLGYAEPLPGRGIRILSIDGGGVRGLAVIELLRKLEQISGRRICDMFDYICGVSTGSVLLSTVGIPQGRSLDECQQLYKKLSSDLFTRHKLTGYTTMVMGDSFYDTDKFETMLQEYIGTSPMIQTNRLTNCPKLSVVSTIVNGDRPWPYVFRNYCIPHQRHSEYMGDHRYQMWEAVRASAAAPTYFKEFHLDGHVHQDGGMTANNPAAVAIHEASLLWPGAGFQCVVSCGTGRTLPKARPHQLHDERGTDKPKTVSLGWREKSMKVLESATDTEGVHHVLDDLLPRGVYYRFNPYLSEVPALDETCPDRLELLRRDTEDYIRKNEARFVAATERLMEEKSLAHKAMDYVAHKSYLWNAHL